KTTNMERTVAAYHNYDYVCKVKKPDTDSLQLSSGDIMLGEDIQINKAAILFQNFIKTISSTIGNHEHDIHNRVKEILPLVNYDLLATNVKINPRSPWAQRTKSSTIKEINGHKYGIIGATPIDLHTRSKKAELQKDISVDNEQETIEDIQMEIDSLRKQGIDKIILLSHLGNDIDKKIAQMTSGLDIILGGHSHNLIYDVKQGENLFYNKDQEPVIITQAGKDGSHFGILNVEFDNKGKIKKVQNNIGSTKDFHRSMPVKYIFDKIFSNNKNLGKINSAPPEPEHYLIAPNPHGYFIADCMKKDLNSDIALIQSANIRGSFETGPIDQRTISEILPFKNKLYRVNYSEKDIVDAIKFAAKNSFNRTDNKPGIFYTSGLKYEIAPNGDVKSITFIDKQGTSHPIDINNPRLDKTYSTIINDYCALGNDNFTMLNQPQKIVEKYDFDASKCVENIISKAQNAIDIRDDGRIKIN
ncbi:5'-nucleotidase C-terminal domain-containing protein, partial [bacterium]|nr:5'-nucleotidase C-terminal domain-containing protein [bacterium]